jgi:hypothetical protein
MYNKMSPKQLKTNLGWKGGYTLSARLCYFNEMSRVQKCVSTHALNYDVQPVLTILQRHIINCKIMLDLSTVLVKFQII